MRMHLEFAYTGNLNYLLYFCRNPLEGDAHENQTERKMAALSVLLIYMPNL